MRVIVLALAFMCVFEGLMPLVLPRTWQRTLRQLSEINPESVRIMAACVIALGLAVIWLME